MDKHACIIEKIEGIEESFQVESVIQTVGVLPYASILDSALNTHELGRYTILAYEPFMVFQSKKDAITLTDRKGTRQLTQHPFEALRTILNTYAISSTPQGLPFTSGCIGYFSYDLASRIEALPQKSVDDLGIWDMVLAFYNRSILIDHAQNVLYAIGTSEGMEEGEEAPTVARNHVEAVKHMLKNISSRTTHTPSPSLIQKQQEASREDVSIKSNFTKEAYIEMVEKVREYIRNGDIFQANLSQRFEAKMDQEALWLYQELRRRSPAPYAAFLNFGEVQVVSSSPERFFEIKGNRIETRPIKGTRPRGKTQKEDQYLSESLLRSEKDRAELTMIVDLERNDLGRVCEIGSITVDKHAKIEAFANVLHTVSTVSGKLKENVDVVDCLYAMFPGGSITGAPKIRAMEIIEELEPVKRNIYTGAIGYIGFDGNVDLNIAIRTILVKDKMAYYNVGGGIVWDSDPEKEYNETLDKGRLMMEVIRSVGGYDRDEGTALRGQNTSGR